MTNTHQNPRGATSRALLLASVLLAGMLAYPATAAAQSSADIQGAWVEQSQKCGDVFAFRKGKAAFKTPVNIFAPAMIITGKRLTTPQASCSLKSAVPDGNRTAVTLRCANSISHGEVRVILSKLPDGRLARYYDENDQSGSRYTYCSAK
ncbi:MAG: hypothetical protein U1E62_20285 [Alsobacter sp.]